MGLLPVASHGQIAALRRKMRGKILARALSYFRLNPIRALDLIVAGPRVSGGGGRRLCRLVWSISEFGPGNREPHCTWLCKILAEGTTCPQSDSRFDTEGGGAWRFGCRRSLGKSGGRGLWADPRSGFSFLVRSYLTDGSYQKAPACTERGFYGWNTTDFGRPRYIT